MSSTAVEEKHNPVIEIKSLHKAFVIAPSDFKKIRAEAHRRRMSFSQFIRNAALDAVDREQIDSNIKATFDFVGT
jgi:hypothetical protein